jgi:hypothetical protein
MSGFARPGGPFTVRGPFTADMPADARTLLVDMPVGRPAIRPRPQIKGVAGPTPGDDEDHQPGSGEWHDVYPD